MSSEFYFTKWLCSSFEQKSAQKFCTGFCNILCSGIQLQFVGLSQFWLKSDKILTVVMHKDPHAYLNAS